MAPSRPWNKITISQIADRHTAMEAGATPANILVFS
jgi:hypothetical protein